MFGASRQDFGEGRDFFTLGLIDFVRSAEGKHDLAHLGGDHQLAGVIGLHEQRHRLEARHLALGVAGSFGIRIDREDANVLQNRKRAGFRDLLSVAAEEDHHIHLVARRNSPEHGVFVHFHRHRAVALGHFDRDVAQRIGDLADVQRFAFEEPGVGKLVLDVFQAADGAFGNFGFGPVFELHVLRVELGADVDVGQGDQNLLHLHVAAAALVHHLADADRRHQAAAQGDENQNQ